MKIDSNIMEYITILEQYIALENMFNLMELEFVELN